MSKQDAAFLMMATLATMLGFYSAIISIKYFELKSYFK